MKKILTMILVIALILCSFGCGVEGDSGSSANTNSVDNTVKNTSVPVVQESLEERSEKLANKALKTLYNGWNVDGVMAMTVPIPGVYEEMYEEYSSGEFSSTDKIEYVSSKITNIQIDRNVSELDEEAKALGFDETITAVIMCEFTISYKVNGYTLEYDGDDLALVETENNLYVFYVGE